MILRIELVLTFFISLFFSNFQLQAQTNGDAFFGAPIVHDIQMTFTQPSYWDSLVAYKPLDQYLKGDISIDGTLYSNVGIKFKGNSSYNNPGSKKPFKIDMNEFVAGQEVDGLKKLNLNNGFKDPSFMREKLALDFYNQQGLVAPRCTYTKVSINGVYWGLYMVVEEGDTGQFLKRHFANKQGNLFKGDPTGDLRWLGNADSSYYPKYELKTNEVLNDWSDLVSLINTINNSGGNFSNALEPAFNSSSFIKQWAAMNMFVNLDSYIGSGHNYFIYHDTLSNKFEWMAWDINESWGNFKMGMTDTQLKNLSMFFVSAPFNSRPLVQKMLIDNNYKSLLMTTICEWLAYDFSNSALDSKVDSLANAIRSHVYADTKKFYSNAQFEDNLTMDITTGGGPGGGTIFGIKSFITQRRNALTAELAANGCNVDINKVAESPEDLIFYPNPATTFFTLELKNAERNNSLNIINALGQTVIAKTFEFSRESIDVSGLSPGIYLLLVNEKHYKKLLVN